MSELLAQLMQVQAAVPPPARSQASSSVPAPVEQVQALAELIRQRIGAGEASPRVTVPVDWYRNPDGTYKAWSSEGNPVYAYSVGVRAILCGAKGGDGTAVWVAQDTVKGEPPLLADGTKGKAPIIWSGLAVKDRIPAKAVGIAPAYAHLQAK